jgi:AcrR family transcriptional regulator
VLHAARELLADEGLPALTMRALARRLGVAPNALYSHVAGKTELVDALLDDHLAAVHDPTSEATEPVAAVAALMTSTFDALVTAPDLVPLYLDRRGARGTNAVRLGATMDAQLTRAGVGADAIPTARGNLIVHAIGWAAFATADGPPGTRTARDSFVAGLDWLLAGIVRS